MLHYCQVEDVHKRTKLKEDTLEPTWTANPSSCHLSLQPGFGVISHQ